MNKEAILKVADAIENHSIKWLGFNIQTYAGTATKGRPDKLNGCKTVACLAGWTKAVLGMVRTERGLLKWEKKISLHLGGIADELGPVLGLEFQEAHELFHPHDWWRGEITPAQAVAVLRHLAETGKVDWSIASAGSAT